MQGSVEGHLWISVEGRLWLACHTGGVRGEGVKAPRSSRALVAAPRVVSCFRGWGNYLRIIFVY